MKIRFSTSSRVLVGAFKCSSISYSVCGLNKNGWLYIFYVSIIRIIWLALVGNGSLGSPENFYFLYLSFKSLSLASIFKFVLLMKLAINNCLLRLLTKANGVSLDIKDKNAECSPFTKDIGNSSTLASANTMEVCYFF